MFKLFYLAKWFFNCKFLGAKKPLQSVIFINDFCNLNCKHCCIDKNKHSKTYEQIKEELEYSFSAGSRFVDFEGGEPFLWKCHEAGEDSYGNVDKLIALAKKIGFYSTTVTTNAQQKIETIADLVWISLDGMKESHNKIRGEGAFENALKNINESKHKNLNLNMVVNKINFHDIKNVAQLAKNTPNIKRISFNFHTPYKGTESLMLDFKTRTNAIDEIISLKKQGYPVMNSASALKLMKDNNFQKKCYVTNFILPDGKRLNECQGKNEDLCDLCGFAMAGEMKCLMDFNIETILAGLGIRV